jgi:hypothetical protein
LMFNNLNPTISLSMLSFGAKPIPTPGSSTHHYLP